GGKGENHDLKLGSGAFVPGFEEQIVGMSAGDEKDIDITFPEDYTPELAGAAVVFHVKCNEVKENVLPELDDEFAKDVSEFDTLEEYKASIKAEILERKSESSEKDFKAAALQKAVDNMEVEVPDAMVDEQVDRVCEDYARNCAMQGFEFGQYLGMMGMDENTFRAMMRLSAANEVRTQIFLEACAEAEGIVVADEDIEKEYTTAAEAYSMDVEELKKAISTEIIARDLKMRKAADVVAEAAVATEVKAEDAE
ncbi:MAG: trigger factor, partial [Oscillospiraceae bacterium]|nr:trigger factor [Oscillospiraceae bacterium]